jgi:transposase
VVDTGRRRRWSFEEKLRIVEESHQGHRQVSATARRHGISASLLFSWRRDFREGRLGGGDFPDLVPAVVFPDPELPSAPRLQERSSEGRARHAGSSPRCGCRPGSPAFSKPATDGRMEIVIGDDRRVIVNADVDGPALARVLKVLGRR